VATTRLFHQKNIELKHKNKMAVVERNKTGETTCSRQRFQKLIDKELV
jgi:hypothetical protein